MNETLFTISLAGATWTVTLMKIVGVAGTLMFGGRWFVQAIASHFAKKPILPSLFWYMSIAGSAMTLSYFIWGKNDSVGIISNVFPLSFACYNLYLHFTHKKGEAKPPQVS